MQCGSCSSLELSHVRVRRGRATLVPSMNWRAIASPHSASWLRSSLGPQGLRSKSQLKVSYGCQCTLSCGSRRGKHFLVSINTSMQKVLRCCDDELNSPCEPLSLWCVYECAIACGLAR